VIFAASAVLLAAAGCAASGAERLLAYRLATFSTDVTPPVGHPLLGGPWARAKSIADPLSARGISLLGPDQPLVIATVDWCEIRGDAYDAWRRALAQAAGTTASRVLLASVHQHDAPLADLRAQELLGAAGLPGAILDPELHAAAIERAAAALRASLSSAVEVTHVGVGRARVEKLASNRRVVLPDGTAHFGRYSFTPDATVRDAPEGEIDPWLRTLSFWNGDTPLAALSAYACHPTSRYGGGEVSADFVGLARARREEAAPGVFQLYACGASGDVTGGKYNDGTPATRAAFAERLHAAMVAAWSSTARYPLEKAEFRLALLRLPPRDDDAFRRPVLERTLADSQAPLAARVRAALGLSWLERVERGTPIDVPAIDFGPAALVLLPAESFVAYQLAAQAMRPGDLVVTLGYGECGPGYVPTDAARVAGYVEEHDWCGVGPAVETLVLEALRLVLLPGAVLPAVAGRTLAKWSADLADPRDIVRLRAVKTLGAFGEEARAPLTAALADANAGVRYWAASHLGELGTRSALGAGGAASDTLRKKLLELEEKDPEPAVRMAAAFALASAEDGEELGRRVEKLTAHLADPERSMALSAAEFLGRLGPKAKGAVPALERAFEAHAPASRGSGVDYHVRGAVQNALRKIEPGWGRR
jgi:hypothetical protein